MMSQMLERQHIVEVRINRGATPTPVAPISAITRVLARTSRLHCYWQLLIPSITEPILREPPRVARAAHQHRRAADAVY